MCVRPPAVHVVPPSGLVVFRALGDNLRLLSGRRGHRVRSRSRSRAVPCRAPRAAPCASRRRAVPVVPPSRLVGFWAQGDNLRLLSGRSGGAGGAGRKRRRGGAEEAAGRARRGGRRGEVRRGGTGAPDPRSSTPATTRARGCRLCVSGGAAWPARRRARSVPGHPSSQQRSRRSRFRHRS